LLQSSFCIGQKKYANGVEPGAGTWKTFVISSPDLFQPPPPPGKQTTINELKQIIELQKKTDSNVLQEIHYWNAGPPVYRWQKIADNINDTNQYWIRVYAYLNVAIYDATVAAWKAKYKYNRVRPSEASGSIKNLVLLSFSPSYPCEHSVTAGAAATVFGYLFPAKKDSTMG
jgi:membrane-associated phospholipid phosphatase